MPHSLPAPWDAPLYPFGQPEAPLSGESSALASPPLPFCSSVPQPSLPCLMLYTQISAPGTETQVPILNFSLHRQVIT